MNAQNKFDQVKAFFERMGKRNLMIAGAVLLIGVAVLLNWVFFNGSGGGDGFTYDASAGMSSGYGTTMTTTAVGVDTSEPSDVLGDADGYFSSVEVSRQRARDEALEVLNAVVDNEQADEAVKAEALKEIQTIAKEMAQESNIESLLMSKGFEQCVAVISGNNANIVVKNEGQLQAAQLAQINAVVYEQAGIEPINITIVAKN